MKKFLAIILGLSALIASVSLGYYLVIFIPKKEEMRIEQEKWKAEQEKITENEKARKEEDQRSVIVKSRANCLADLQIKHGARWIKDCESRGLKSDCKLPLNVIEVYAEDLKREQDNCLKLFAE